MNQFQVPTLLQKKNTGKDRIKIGFCLKKQTQLICVSVYKVFPTSVDCAIGWQAAKAGLEEASKQARDQRVKERRANRTAQVKREEDKGISNIDRLLPPPPPPRRTPRR